MTFYADPVDVTGQHRPISAAGGDGLRVLHLNTFDDSGASRGSVWLHRALRRKKVDSLVLVGRKTSDDPTILTPDGIGRMAAKLRMRLDQLPLRSYQKTDEAFWSIGWLPAWIGAQVRALRPDIIHLHWVGNGFLGIREIAALGRPLVWTLRDMWPMTGGCHYTGDCIGYRESCGRCPQLRSAEPRDLSRRVWESKLRHWRGADLSLVPISAWLDECVKHSPLLRSFPSTVIPNGLDIETFRPYDKDAARRQWNLPTDRRIMLFGAINAMRDPRKGFAELVEALRVLARTGDRSDVLMVVFGDLTPCDLPDTGIAWRHLGFIDDDRLLAQLYAAADLSIAPSIQEAFGKTLIEAMACGAPVVAFASGGPKDIVSHRRDGYLAQPFRPDDLAAGMAWCLDALDRGELLAARARAKVEAEFDIDLVADRYIDLYRRILAGESEAVPQELLTTSDLTASA